MPSRCVLIASFGRFFWSLLLVVSFGSRIYDIFFWSLREAHAVEVRADRFYRVSSLGSLLMVFSLGSLL